MAVFSVLRQALKAPIISKSLIQKNGLAIQLRNGSSNKLVIEASKWSSKKFWDILHFYVMLGVIPIAAVAFYANVFIGPAQLAPIPEGYEPKEWEYYSNPIQRWCAKYLYRTFQEEYEREIHYAFEENERIESRRVDSYVRFLINNRQDTRAGKFRAPPLKYIKEIREVYDSRRENIGGR